MDAETLKVAALWWLRLTKRCPIVVFEFDFMWHGRADVWGITESRYPVEVETKISAGDLRREFDKRKHFYRDAGAFRAQAYYSLCVPENLVDLAMELRKPDWGVLTPSGCTWSGGPLVLTSVAPAKKNKDAQRVGVRDCIRLVRRQAIQMADMAARIETLRRA